MKNTIVLFISLILLSCDKPKQPKHLHCKTTLEVKFNDGQIDTFILPVSTNMVGIRIQDKVSVFGYHGNFQFKIVATNVRSYSIVDEICN